MALDIVSQARWPKGKAPVAVVLITLNEAHSLHGLLENLKGWAEQVFIVDSLSVDDTVNIALSYGVHLVQRRFSGFGDQWNFAISSLPITSPWTMKMDPDERLSDSLKESLLRVMMDGAHDGFSFFRRLWFLQKPLPVLQPVVRVWKTGKCRFTDVAVNEHPIVDGSVLFVCGEMQHHDSPNLEHWLYKQNLYTSSEARMTFLGSALAFKPRLLGTSLERRMWLKKNFHIFPFRFFTAFLFYLVFAGAWRAGLVGIVWARLRSDVLRFREYKVLEMRLYGSPYPKMVHGSGNIDPRVPFISS